MSSSARAESNKPKHSKLRASCDTCFLAKVKCSKARPICSRCLACGADCTYSPSSRAGKPKSARRPAAQEPRHSVAAWEESAGQYPTPSMSIDVEQQSSYGMETDWSSVLGPPGGGLHRPSLASTARPGTQPSRSKSLSAPVPIIPPPPVCWDQVAGLDTPASQLDISLPSSHDSSPRPSSRSARCHCVPRCLAALHALHPADVRPAGSPFDGILTTNQRAVDTCARMLACPRCPAASAPLRTLLLGTLLGRIVAVYQEASTSYFARAANQLPLSLGSYRVAGADARWLQTEIILRDLEKLRELVARFRETGAGGARGADVGMHDAVSRFLCRSLELTFDTLRRQRAFLGEAASCGL
ncbi:transcription factor [Diplocarpon rosae]|nr:transcription factor [Diplocarpon rosae]